MGKKTVGSRSVNAETVQLDDIMCLDTEIYLWFPPTISGKPPSPRSGHAAALVNDAALVVLGGKAGRKWRNDCYLLDVERWHWQLQSPAGAAPAPRSYHSATVVGRKVVVFGGNGEGDTYGDVHVLDTGTAPWSWSAPVTVGATAPCPRTGHGAVLLSDGKSILIHGGWDPDVEGDDGGPLCFSDSFVLDTDHWTWSRGPLQLASPGDADEPAARVGHALVAAANPGGGSRCWSFGGQTPGGTRDAALLLADVSR